MLVTFLGLQQDYGDKNIPCLQYTSPTSDPIFNLQALKKMLTDIFREYHVNGTKNIQKHTKVSNMTKKKLYDKILFLRYAIRILIFMKILYMSKKELCQQTDR